MSDKPKNITFFVAGGKGTQPFMDMFLHGKDQYNIVINTVDWGGHTGKIGRILEELNLKFLPIGDLRNNIANMLYLSNKEEIADSLQNRVETMTEAKEALQDICKLIAIDSNLEKGIFEFFNIYEKGLKNTKSKDGVEGIKHNIGNLLFVGIAYAVKEEDKYFGGFSAMVLKLKDLSLIPENVKFHFLFNSRLTLSFRTKDGIIHHGEHAYDEAKSQIDLSTLNYVDPETKIKYFDLNKYIIDLINQSDLIVFPTGSESNFYPAIKMYSKHLKSKRIVKLVNILALPNSEGIEAEMVYLYGLGLKPIYLFPKDMTSIMEELDDATTKIFFRDLGIYTAVEEKRPQFFKEAKIKDMLYDMARIKLYKFHQSEQAELDQIVNSIMENIQPAMDVLAFNNNNKQTINKAIRAAGKYDAALLDKGLRHDRKQVAKVINSKI